MSNIWHGYVDGTELRVGTILVVTGGEEPVNVDPGSDIGIELSHGLQINAHVVLHEADRMVLELSTGEMLELNRMPDDVPGADLAVSDGFSHQAWVVR